jgi:hypothetical protein
MINLSEAVLVPLCCQYLTDAFMFLYLVMSCFVNSGSTCSFGEFGLNQIPGKKVFCCTDYVMDLSERITHEHIEK